MSLIKNINNKGFQNRALWDAKVGVLPLDMQPSKVCETARVANVGPE